MNDVWLRAADRMRNALGSVGYETWIGPLNFISLEERTATIEAPNKFFRDWVQDNYRDMMCQMLSTELGSAIDVKLTLGKEVNGNGNNHSNGVVNGVPANGNARPAAPRPPI